jgi:uncharacterized membrane protein YdjX (TVP38/TMEM64 family)
MSVAMVAALTGLGLLVPFNALLVWVRGAGPWGPAVFVALYVVATVAFTPGSVLAASAGAVYGFQTGCLLAFIGGNLGAVCAFLLARALGRARIERRVSHLGRLDELDRAITRHGIKAIVLLRFSHAPSNALNYALGVTSVSVRQVLIGNLLGLVPGIAFVVYAASVGGTALGIREIDGQRGPAEWALFAASLVLSVVATWLLVGHARRAMGGASDPI